MRSKRDNEGIEYAVERVIVRVRACDQEEGMWSRGRARGRGHAVEKARVRARACG